MKPKKIKKKSYKNYAFGLILGKCLHILLQSYW